MSHIAPELLADATVEARIFLARVKPRTLRTNTGRVVTTTEIAEELVKRAALDAAVLPGVRPTTVLCADCKTPLQVHAGGGRVPTRCFKCGERERSRRGWERDKERRRQLRAKRAAG